jgi:hypothetical protein
MKKIIKAFAFMLFIGVLFVNSKSLTKLNESSSINLSNLELIQVASAESSSADDDGLRKPHYTRTSFTIVNKYDEDGNLEYTDITYHKHYQDKILGIINVGDEYIDTDKDKTVRHYP